MNNVAHMYVNQYFKLNSGGLHYEKSGKRVNFANKTKNVFAKVHNTSTFKQSDKKRKQTKSATSFIVLSKHLSCFGSYR
jgi:hypothetical protein